MPPTDPVAVTDGTGFPTKVRSMLFVARIIFFGGLLAATLFVSSPRALALATEHFDTNPVPAGFINLSPDALALANLKSRFYWREVNGNPTFFYRGDADALNEA